MIPQSPHPLHQMLSLSDLFYFIMQIYCLYVPSLLFFVDNLSFFLDSYVLKLEKADVYRLPYLSSSGPGFGLYFTFALTLLEAARKANFKDIASQVAAGFASGRPSFIPAKSLWPSLIPAISPCSQSQGRKPNSFQFPRVINSGKRLSRSVESSSENIHRQRLFRRTFPATSFSCTARSACRRPPIFPKAPEPENHPRAGHARFSGQRLHLTRRRVRAREPLSGDTLPSPASPDAD
ncbi:hypothetical protein CK203_037103 [Vitis vinifera]|uniref:Uncharacterized protein n=1 Tax=Vitis vinifera TaxID=29760 RepID=A0A438I5R6_VITVI|nr:hypothetical protein CK203_037103 [Vitis vinifera]